VLNASNIALRNAVRDNRMILISGGTFRTGSDRHYPKEAAAHRVTIGTFSMDRAPVTNRQFREFVRAIGHKVAVGRWLPIIVQLARW
jgi:formylglycine-generating enzyme required for sulfatase activity